MVYFIPFSFLHWWNIVTEPGLNVTLKLCNILKIDQCVPRKVALSASEQAGGTAVVIWLEILLSESCSVRGKGRMKEGT